MSANALNCPNCGAGVASDRAICQFCGCRLRTMACARCFKTMFIGSQFCDHCGSIAAPLDVKLVHKLGDCPRCRRSLEQLKVDDISFRGCPSCDGLWLDAKTFESICTDRERQFAVLSFTKRSASPAEAPTKISYVPCPDCGELMNRNNFAKASGVIVDICHDHGVWFDADELTSIVDFVQKGGMQVARERELAEIKEERAKLRAERFAINIQEPSQSAFADTPAIRSFIHSLFG